MTDINSLEDNQMFSSLTNTECGLKNFTYPNDLLTNTTFRHLQNTSLNGITVQYSYNNGATHYRLASCCMLILLGFNGVTEHREKSGFALVGNALIKIVIVIVTILHVYGSYNI